MTEDQLSPDPVPGAETLAETQRRLLPYGPPAGGVPEPPAVIPADYVPLPVAAPDPIAPPVPRKRRPRKPRSTSSPSSSSATTPTTTSNRRVITVAVVAAVTVVVVLLAGVVGIAREFGGRVGTALDAPSSSPVADEWTTYPGSAYADSADVLAAPSMETTVAQSQAFEADLKAALTDSLGLAWTQNYDAYLEQGSNGYGGDSMLYDYDAPEWQGAAVVDSPTSRSAVYAAFGDIAKKYGATDVWRANDSYKDDVAGARKQFGGTSLSNQPEWTFYADDAIAPGINVTASVLDLNLPRDAAFTGESWFKLDDVPKGSVVVTIDITSYGLLSDADRDAFTKAIASYDESEKPDGR